mmetsp:Transcript_20034/g.36788  ORF Transcript_20034/g.36788 Transcript_20034/m.36788 type:complete len:318 (+) Transcript_20034:472-1425(+)
MRSQHTNHTRTPSSLSPPLKQKANRLENTRQQRTNHRPRQRRIHLPQNNRIPKRFIVLHLHLHRLGIHPTALAIVLLVVRGNRSVVLLLHLLGNIGDAGHHPFFLVALLYGTFHPLHGAFGALQALATPSHLLLGCLVVHLDAGQVGIELLSRDATLHQLFLIDVPLSLDLLHLGGDFFKLFLRVVVPPLLVADGGLGIVQLGREPRHILFERQNDPGIGLFLRLPPRGNLHLDLFPFVVLVRPSPARHQQHPRHHRHPRPFPPLRDEIPRQQPLATEFLHVERHDIHFRFVLLEDLGEGGVLGVDEFADFLFREAG